MGDLVPRGSRRDRSPCRFAGSLRERPTPRSGYLERSEFRGSEPWAKARRDPISRRQSRLVFLVPASRFFAEHSRALLASGCDARSRTSRAVRVGAACASGEAWPKRKEGNQRKLRIPTRGWKSRPPRVEVTRRKRVLRGRGRPLSRSVDSERTGRGVVPKALLMEADALGSAEGNTGHAKSQGQPAPGPRRVSSIGIVDQGTYARVGQEPGRSRRLR